MFLETIHIDTDTRLEDCVNSITEFILNAAQVAYGVYLDRNSCRDYVISDFDKPVEHLIEILVRDSLKLDFQSFAELKKAKIADRIENVISEYVDSEIYVANLVGIKNYKDNAEKTLDWVHGSLNHLWHTKESLAAEISHQFTCGWTLQDSVGWLIAQGPCF
jgi:glycosylphosphatidylinositol transamidase (GPIT) subunit GPI8